MKITQYGYTTKEVKEYHMTMAAMKETILQAMVRNNLKDCTVKLVNTTLAEVDVFHGMDELIMADFNGSWDVKVTRMTHVLSGTEKYILVNYEDDEQEDISII